MFRYPHLYWIVTLGCIEIRFICLKLVPSPQRDIRQRSNAIIARTDLVGRKEELIWVGLVRVRSRFSVTLGSPSRSLKRGWRLSGPTRRHKSETHGYRWDRRWDNFCHGGALWLLVNVRAEFRSAGQYITPQMAKHGIKIWKGRQKLLLPSSFDWQRISTDAQTNWLGIHIPLFWFIQRVWYFVYVHLLDVRCHAY